MVTVHVWDAPLHAPPQPAKVDPAVGDADSETGVPEGYASEQSEPQLIPGGLAKPRAKLSKGQMSIELWRTQARYHPGMIRPRLSILLVAWAVAAACSNEAGRTAESSGIGAVPPGSLIYLEGASLRSFDLDSRDTGTLADLPSPDVALSPDGNRYVAVVETGAAVPDGYSKPKLRIGPTDGGDTTSLGPGRSPRWSPGGDQIAAVTPGPSVVDCPLTEGNASRFAPSACRPTTRSRMPSRTRSTSSAMSGRG
jgi:hypothetical protein